MTTKLRHLLPRILLVIGAWSASSAQDAFLPSHSQPDPLPSLSANCSLTCTLHNGTSEAGWRLKGETLWRASNSMVTLLMAGPQWLEFKVVTGRAAPASREVQVAGAGTTEIASYAIAPEPVGTGSLRVVIGNTGPDFADGIWRLAGQPTWKPSDSRLTGLASGVVTVQFRPVSDWLPPDSAEVRIIPNQGVLLERSYHRQGTGTWAFNPLTSGAVSGAPYRYLGKIHSPKGVFTGIAVGQYTVLTTRDAVLDPVTGGFVDGVTWTHSKHTGSRISSVQPAAGFVLMKQWNDLELFDPRNCLVAIYFTKPAANGGWSGLHVREDSVSWLNAGRLAQVAGYAGEGGPAEHRGKLHATGIGPLPEIASDSMTKLFSLTGFPDLPGLRGAPLFTRRSNGKYYPAAIFVGGGDGITFKEFDAEVLKLVESSEAAALLDNGGTFSNGIKITTGDLAPTTAPKGKVRTIIEGAPSATWMVGERSGLRSDQVIEIAQGSPTVAFSAVSNFQAPAPRGIQVISNTTVELIATYGQSYQAWAAGKFTLQDIGTEKTGQLQDFDSDGVVNLLERSFGLDPKLADATVDAGLPLIETTAQGLTVHFFRSKSAVEAGTTYHAEFASTLGDWVPNLEEEIVHIDSEWDRVSVTDSGPMQGGKRFARVKVEHP